MEHLYSHTDRTSNGCMLWRGACNGEGYAVRRLYGVTEGVHRITWQREYQHRPNILRNKCGNKNCINPQHWRETRTPVCRAHVHKKKPVRRRAYKVRLFNFDQ